MKTESCDVLIIGAGGAGLRAAVEAKLRGAEVMVVNKGKIGQTGCTVHSASDWMAFGAALGHSDPRDSPKEHWIDIMVKGCLVAEPRLAKLIAYEAPKRLLELEKWGAKFDKTEDGKFKQVLSDGARFPRACGKGADTGPEIVRVLIDKCEELGVKFIENIMVSDLIKDSGGKIAGAFAIDLESQEDILFQSKAIILATGGAGDLYVLNVFPEGMTGDGYALAYRSGAKLVNMEFVQIGPCIVHPIKFALSGVFWRLKPRIYNRLGEEFLPKYIPQGVDLDKAIYLKGVSFPFTVRNESKWVDVGIFTEIMEGRGTKRQGVYMDISHNSAKAIEEKAKVPFEHLLESGIDIRKEPVEFAPAIQHFNGGVLTNEKGETGIPGLYAAGEVAGGQHGADRPGGNSLAHCQVSGKICGENAAKYAEKIHKFPSMREVQGCVSPLINKEQASIRESDRYLISRLRANLQRLMWEKVSVTRSDSGLKEVLEEIDVWETERRKTGAERTKDWMELDNLLEVGKIVALSAQVREESRGTHYREDFPKRDDERWLKQIIIWKGEKGDPQVSFRNIKLPEELGDLKEMLEGE